jgi:hypothetical protein
MRHDVVQGRSTLKTEVYSWRVSPEIKTGMEHAEGVREEQIRLQGVLASGNVRRSENARRAVRRRLQRRQH